MEDLAVLKQKRDELDKLIEMLEQEAADKEKSESLEEDYVPVVCPECKGMGKIDMGGESILSDPPSEGPCPRCGTQGYLNGRVFEGKRVYSLSYSEI